MNKDILTFERSKNNHIVLLVLSTLFFIVGVAIVLGAKDGDAKSFRAGLICIFFFGILIFFSARQLLDTKPHLVLDESGLTYRLMGNERVLWNEIKDVYVKSVSGKNYICLELRNPEQWTSKLSTKYRLIARLNKAFWGENYYINAWDLNVHPNELLTLIVERVEKSQSHREF